MTEPTGFNLLELATPYALNALSPSERVSIDRQLATAPGALAAAFADEVRAVRETMAMVSAATAAEPPEHLRAALIAAIQRDSAARPRWRTAILAVAAAILVALAGFGAGIALRPLPKPTMADQIMAAPDVRSTSTPIAGGTATVMFSRDRNGAVLLMNNVPPPAQGTVYQMWLIGDKGPSSAGTMNTAAVTPSTTHTFTSLQNSSVLAFTVEPGEGSPQPTGTILAKLPLT
jgi:anti-sigma-K factor RskA